MLVSWVRGYKLLPTSEVCCLSPVHLWLSVEQVEGHSCITPTFPDTQTLCKWVLLSFRPSFLPVHIKSFLGVALEHILLYMATMLSCFTSSQAQAYQSIHSSFPSTDILYDFKIPMKLSELILIETCNIIYTHIRKQKWPLVSQVPIRSYCTALHNSGRKHLPPAKAHDFQS